MKHLLSILWNLLFLITLSQCEDYFGKEKEIASVSETDPYPVYVYRIGTKFVYECNNFYFFKENYAKQYHLYLYSKKNGTINPNYRPKEGKKYIPMLEFRHKYLIGQFIDESFYNINMFSKFIHDRIWGSCDHDCASKNNFKEFKKRSLEELNEYRKLHYANKLYTSESLDKIAQKEADRYIKTKGDQTCKLKDDYGCVTSKLYKTFITFFIQTLYDELLLTYRWKKKYLKRKHLHLVQLIWRKAKYIGIGIAKDKDFVYFVLAFSSKVKTHSGYKYNVLPIRNKYILKYRNLI